MTNEELELVDSIVKKGKELARNAGLAGFFFGIAVASLLWLVLSW